MKYNCIVTRSRRRSVSLRVRDDLTVLIRAPYGISDETIERIVSDKQDWIAAAAERVCRNNEAQSRLLCRYGGADGAKAAAMADLLPRLRHYSELSGLRFASLKITSAAHRFGSCGPDGRICLSYRLLAYPPAARDYVVMHELAHIRHRDHGEDFYRLIARYMPDHKRRRKLLAEPTEI